ncbi:UNVERIFIED_CONTAM: hypothetical protein FKN15_069763 [Acipenser sinensis]
MTGAQQLNPATAKFHPSQPLVVGRTGDGAFLSAPVLTEGVPCTALIDSGSSITVVCPDVLHQAIGDWRDRVRLTPVHLKTVMGERAPMEGRGQLRVTYAGRTFRHEVWLATVQDCFILGLDFLRRSEQFDRGQLLFLSDPNPFSHPAALSRDAPFFEQERDPLHPRPYWKEFRFDLTPIPQGEAVTAAEFRIYKARSYGHRGNRTLHISVYEIVKEHTNRESDLLLLDLQQVHAGDEGWLVFDVATASNRWLLNPRSNLGLRLYVETDEGRSSGSRDTARRETEHQQRDTLECCLLHSLSFSFNNIDESTDNVCLLHSLSFSFNNIDESTDNVCLLHSLSFSFNNIDESTDNDWVIAPQGYSAYYCDGECSYPLGSCMNATNHAIMQLVDWVIAPQGYSAYYCDGECSYPLGSCMNATNHAIMQLVPDEVPKACCAPTKLSPISVLFYDDNNNVILKKHRNMVVKACGCH